MAKSVVPMSLHRYNWKLPQRAGGSQPYFACNGLGDLCSDLQVIAFSPELEKLLGSSASWHEFALIIRGLAARWELPWTGLLRGPAFLATPHGSAGQHTCTQRSHTHHDSSVEPWFSITECLQSSQPVLHHQLKLIALVIPCACSVCLTGPVFLPLPLQVGGLCGRLQFKASKIVLSSK